MIAGAGSPRAEGWRVVGVAVLAIAAALATACNSAPPPADLILLHGKIVTVDPAIGEVTALAALEGRIVAVGDDREIERYRGAESRVIDLEGRLAIPGFIEGHAHFAGLGASLLNVDLRGAGGWPEVVERVVEVAAELEQGTWILGRGWHQEKWQDPLETHVEGYPTHDALSLALPDHPVILTHASGHASIVNARAMELAGIDASTPDPAGGEILRDSDGRPTGVLIEEAEGLVQAAYESQRRQRTADELAARARQELELADDECLSKGITSFQDAGTGFETLDLMREMARNGEIDVRLWVMLGADNEALERRAAEYRTVGAANEHLTVRAIKRLVDGALGAHGAWLLEPYADHPGSSGHNTIPLEELERTARIALAHDMQLCVHAIGDRGNRETLDLYERVFAETTGGGRDLRWRIEHAQILHPDEIPRFAGLGVIASMQGIHCTSDGPWVPERLGEARAARGAYVWRDLIDSGAVISNGTDAPVEDVDPIPNYHALVTRRTAAGEPFFPAQRMTRMEALRAYTINAAYAAFEDGIKGSLTPGKLADITVLTEDILTAPEATIVEAEVLYTIVGGEVLYAHPDRVR